MCEYCTGKETKEITPSISIEGKLLWVDLEFGFLAAEIKYCPMCGRKLKEKT